MPPEEIYKSYIHVIWTLGNELDVLFIWLMVNSTQAVSCPSHYSNMISLVKVITKFPQVLNDINKR